MKDYTKNGGRHRQLHHRPQRDGEATAKKFGISKSTVHKDMVDRLQHINPSLASQVRVVLDINKSERHIRGGMATKEKYQHRLAICSKDDEE